MSKIGFIDEMIADMKSGVFDRTVNGDCSNCGQCCGNYLPVSKTDIKRIKQYIAKNDIKEQIRRLPVANNVFDFQCPFRDEGNKKCTIYEVRPAICRDFKCDKPRKEIEINKSYYNGKYDIVDMRFEFFGGESVFAAVIEEMLNGR